MNHKVFGTRAFDEFRDLRGKRSGEDEGIRITEIVLNKSIWIYLPDTVPNEILGVRNLDIGFFSSNAISTKRSLCTFAYL